MYKRGFQCLVGIHFALPIFDSFYAVRFSYACVHLQFQSVRIHVSLDQKLEKIE